jgi:Rod binding domain-containing protein
MIPLASPDATTLARPGVAAIWKTAQAFEAMAIGQMLAPIFDTVDSARGLFGGGAAEQAWRPMITQEMGRQIGAAGGFGLAVPVFRQMLLIQEQAQTKDTRS